MQRFSLVELRRSRSERPLRRHELVARSGILLSAGTTSKSRECYCYKEEVNRVSRRPPCCTTLTTSTDSKARETAISQPHLLHTFPHRHETQQYQISHQHEKRDIQQPQQWAVSHLLVATSQIVLYGSPSNPSLYRSITINYHKPRNTSNPPQATTIPIPTSYSSQERVSQVRQRR